MTNFSRQAMRRNIYLLTAFLLWGLVPGVRGADDGTTKLEKDADGYYLVSNTDDLAELARIVNNGSVRDIRVRQTEDIDMSGVSWTPIGNGPIYHQTGGAGEITNGGFEGLYDGQGHTVSNFRIAGTSEAAGLFGVVTGTVRNMGIINASYSAAQDCRAGGLAGVVTATGSNAGLVENCFVKNSSILTSERVCGGVVGAVCGGTVQNCYGLNNQLTGSGGRFGGVAGDTRNDAGWTGTVLNCYTDHERVTSTQAGSTLNCEASVSGDRFASGEITFLLNGGVTFDVEAVWRQDLGEDEAPVLDRTHGFVMQSGEGYINLSDGDLDTARDGIYRDESEFNANVICLISLNDSYEELLDILNNALTSEEFFHAYEALLALKAEMVRSASYYAAYQAKVDEVRAYLSENDNFSGPKRDLLETYMDEVISPNATYPNGSYAYIIRTRTLGNEALERETASVQTMLDDAIKSGYLEGADISSLIVNPDFSGGTRGWTIQNGSLSISAAVDASVGHVAHSTNKLTISQTLQGLAPGIYQVRVNAIYRAAADISNLNQTAFLFANNNKVYLPTFPEDVIPMYCQSPHLVHYSLFEDKSGRAIGYVPLSAEAMCYAFSEGYYESTIVGEVGEDGKLTLGVQTLGCNEANDTWIGAFHLKYCGTADSETADKAFDATLACQHSRLHTLAYDYVCSSFDYNVVPSYSQSLRTEIKEALEDSCASQDKYAQIAYLGNLMQRVYDCKQSYSAVLAKGEVILNLYKSLVSTGALTVEESNALLSAYGTICDAYIEGYYTPEEALDANPFTGLVLMPFIVDGVAEISNARDFVIFSAIVNSGFYRDLDAVLLSDLDLSSVYYYSPIGYAPNSELNTSGQSITNPGYAGTFDGQGHVIRNLRATYDANFASSGVFGTVTGTVKNLGIENYHFVMSEAETSYPGRFGALCGQLVEGRIENCYVTGSTVINPNEIVSSIAAGNYGGVVENCYEFGNNIQPYPRAGHLVGDGRDDRGVRVGTVINCYSSGYVTGAGRSNGYPSNVSHSESQVSAARFESGEIAYLLNGGETFGPGRVWYQTLGEDDSPVLDTNHSIVLRTGNGAYTNSSETNTALFALIEEAQALAQDYEKLEEPDAAVALAVDRLSALATEKLKVAKAGEGTQDDINALQQLVDDLLTLTAVESQSITAVRRISSGVYSLDGRRIRPAATDAPLKSLSKGLYIVNGRKTWVR